MALVDFAVVGAQKSGTTALRRFLSAHSEICVTQSELHYFNRDYKNDCSPNYAGYHSRFGEEARTKVTGDFTPAYLYLSDSLDRMQIYNPDMKIIVLLRDPVERAYSQWVMQVERGQETRSFGLAILHEIKVYLSRGRDVNFSYLQRGFYDRQLAYLFSVFPEDQCLIVKHTDLRWRHHDTLSRILRFLGVGEHHIPPPETIHARDYMPMNKAMGMLLRCIYARDSRKLERRLGWKRKEWRA